MSTEQKFGLAFMTLFCSFIILLFLTVGWAFPSEPTCGDDVKGYEFQGATVVCVEEAP